MKPAKLRLINPKHTLIVFSHEISETLRHAHTVPRGGGAGKGDGLILSFLRRCLIINSTSAHRIAQKGALHCAVPHLPRSHLRTAQARPLPPHTRPAPDSQHTAPGHPTVTHRSPPAPPSRAQAGQGQKPRVLLTHQQRQIQLALR